MPSETCTEPTLAHIIQRSYLGMQRFSSANRQHRGTISVLTETCNGVTVINSSRKAKKPRPPELRELHVSALCRLLSRRSQRTLFVVGREALRAHRHTRTAPRAFVFMKSLPLLPWTSHLCSFLNQLLHSGWIAAQGHSPQSSSSRALPAFPPATGSAYTRRHFFVLKINLS